MTSVTTPAPIDRDAMIRDELLSALPHLRRLPDRIDRILTLTSRGELRVRNIVDEDVRRILRTLVNRALLVAVGCRVPGRGGGAARRRRSRPGGGWRHRAVRGLRLLRPPRRHGAPAPCRRGRHPGWDDMTQPISLDAEVTTTPGGAVRRRLSASGRSLLPPSGRRRPPRPLGDGAPAPGAVRRAGDPDQPGRELGSGPRGHRGARRGARVPARSHPDRGHRVPGAGGRGDRRPPALAPARRGDARGRCRRGTVRAAGHPVRCRWFRARRGHRRHLGGFDRLPVAGLRRGRRARSSPPGSPGCAVPGGGAPT